MVWGGSHQHRFTYGLSLPRVSAGTRQGQVFLTRTFWLNSEWAWTDLAVLGQTSCSPTGIGHLRISIKLFMCFKMWCFALWTLPQPTPCKAPFCHFLLPCRLGFGSRLPSAGCWALLKHGCASLFGHLALALLLVQFWASLVKTGGGLRAAEFQKLCRVSIE